MKSIPTIAFKEFRDRLRSGWVVGCMIVWFAAILLTSLFGLVQIGRIGVQGYERTAMSLLNLSQYLAPLLGLLVGHDIIVREREDRTLHLILAGGVRRGYLLIGKFLGAALTASVPLFVGFIVAGALIGLASHDVQFTPFLKLGLSAIALGIIFAGFATLISTLARSRVQALVCALIAWGIAIFAFDLVALGIIVSQKATQASEQIEVICDATHVNSQTDVHSGFEGDIRATRVEKASPPRFSWVWLNPVDVFRAINLSLGGVSASLGWAIASGSLWIFLPLITATWRFKHADL